MTIPLRLGYKASSEQFGPNELVSFGVLAEEMGFDSVFLSDHFQPWMHDGGQTDLSQIIDAYDKGRGVSTKEPGLRILHLSKRDKADLLSFLQCISANPLPIDLPSIPE